MPYRLDTIAAWMLLALSPLVILWGTILYRPFTRLEAAYRAWRRQSPGSLDRWGKTRQGELILRNAAVVAGLLGIATGVGRLFGGDILVLDLLDSRVAPVLVRLIPGW